MKTNPAEFFFDQLQDKLPNALRPFASEARQLGKRFVKHNSEQLDLVSREEFLAQQAQLDAALQRLAELEAKLAALQSRPRPEAQS